MTHKRYKVVTTIYNIIVLLIVTVVQKYFCVHFSCPLPGYFLDFGLLVWIWSSPEFVMKACSEIFRGIEWIKDKSGKGLYFTLVTPHALPPPPPPPPLSTGVLHFMGIKNYSKLLGKHISWTKDLTSLLGIKLVTPTQKAVDEPTMECLVLRWCKVLSFEDQILWCNHSNESYWAALLCGTVYYQCCTRCF